MLTPRQLHPVHRATALFFAGLSRDSYARNMSFRSPLLQCTLDEAELSFQQAAATILPSLSPPSEDLGIQCIAEGDGALLSGGTRSGHSSFGSQQPSPALTRNGTAMSDGSNFENESHATHPYPPTRTSSALSPSMLTFKSEDFLEPDMNNHAQRYSRLLTGLHLLICKHIASIESYRQFVQAAQEREQRFGILLPSKEMTKEEKHDRIVRGKAQNWKRPRFNAQRYQELCDRALGEL